MRPPREMSLVAVLLQLLMCSASATALRRQGGVFNGRVTLVPVDVRVVDQNGKPIVGLSPEDFVVLEDGKQQTISHFERRSLQAEPPGRDVGASPAASAPTHRTFLIATTDLWLPTLPFRTTAALVHFVRQQLLPGDLTAFSASQQATEFTTDHEHVAQVIERLQSYETAIDAKHDIEKKRALALRVLPPSIGAELDEVFRGPEGADVRHVPLTDQLLSTDYLEGELQRVNPPLTSHYTLNSIARVAALQLDRLLAAVRYLRDVDGEKHLIFVTAGIGFASEEDERTVVRLASDARVALDIVLVSNRESGVRFNGAETDVKDISEKTGGVGVIAGYAEQSLRQIEERTRTGYLLGYYPSNAVFDGRYRTITVKVTRPKGARVFCRNGYYPSAPPKRPSHRSNPTQ